MKKFNIGSTDTPAAGVKQDLFHIETYINGLSTFITKCATPMTISIQGDWGSGKTSMMNMIKEKVESEVYPIWFNTWQFSQFDMGNSLIFSMMEVLLEELGCESTLISKLMSGLAGFARKAITVAAETIHEDVGKLVEGVTTPDTNTNYAREILELKDKFQKAINEAITEKNKSRVVVFVDDLDRLQPEKAVELLEVLKLFLDCENCVFVIAVDYEVVTRGIRQKYGVDVNEEKGKSFFDKIIQLPFKVPVAQYDIKNYISKMLSDMNVKVSPETLNLFVQLIQTSIGVNPRSMKRLFNTYQLLDIITKSSVTTLKEADRHRILFAIICMQMGHEKLYHYFACAPIDSTLLEPLGKEQGVKDWLSEVFADEGLVENDSKYFNKMCKFLTIFYKAIQNDNDEDISEGELINLKSILRCSSVLSLGGEETTDTSQVMEERHENKRIAERINEKLSDLGVLKLWLPRRAREDVKLSDVSAKLYFTARENFVFTFEYYLSRTADGDLTAHLIFYNDTARKEALYLNTLGKNPLNLANEPEITSWGRIMYSNVVTGSEKEILEKVPALYRRAYAEIQKFL